MTTSARKNSGETQRKTDGYSLFEILLALGIAAVLLAVSVPYLAESFGRSPGAEASDLLARTVHATRAAALENGEARQLSVSERGLKPDSDSLPAAELAAGWNLEIQRLTDSKFHRPAKKEIWEFNAAGICEPVTFRLTNGRETTTVSFDPLTGIVLDD